MNASATAPERFRLNLPPKRQGMPAPLYYGLPVLVFLAIHWIALRIWFFSDDFAWLGIPLHVGSWRDLPAVLFTPMAQGTVRTISERLFFLVFTSIFGLHALPFRLWVFATQCANLLLLMRITNRITASRVAAFSAPILWSANSGLALAIGWTSSYNEIACAFFILLAFGLFLRYIETGRRGYWIGTWVVFLLGFGALELNVMFPVLACCYALCCARTYLRKAILLFIPSLLFTVLHVLFVPKTGQVDYGMHFDSGIVTIFVKYWSHAVAAYRKDAGGLLSRPVLIAICAAITLPIAAFLFRRIEKRDWLPLFFCAWFVAMLSPVLPLTNHFTEYYLTLPAIGLAMLGGYAISKASAPAWKAVAVVLAGAYVAAGVHQIQAVDAFYRDRSQDMRRIVRSLEASKDQYAGKMILLEGIDNSVFWSGFFDDPFRLLGIRQIYLTPGSETGIDPHPEWGGILRYVIGREEAWKALAENRAVVYRFVPAGLQEATQTYLASVAPQYLAEHPRFVDVGNPIFASRLGDTWFKAEQGFRWMPKSATVHIGGPEKDSQRLYITGYCPASAVAAGPVQVTFRADTVQLGTETLAKADEPFAFSYPLPARAVGKASIEIAIEVSRTFHTASDVRELGMAFGTFEVK